MLVNFIIRGRLGNAIFRYLASALICILNNGIYAVNESHAVNGNNLSDDDFKTYQSYLLNDKAIEFSKANINMNCFYQHDLIYRKYKNQIINFANANPNHTVVTDGKLAGDNNCEIFYMKDIIHVPNNFTKKYKNVLHIRLEDFVTHNLYLKPERIIDLINANVINLINDTLCVVCSEPTTHFEKEYINLIKNALIIKNIKMIQESNDAITDYYIMKEAELLICSKSTLSWCAALLSTSIKTCYIPKNDQFQFPIDNSHAY